MFTDLTGDRRWAQRLAAAAVGLRVVGAGGIVGGCDFEYVEAICEPHRVVVVTQQGGGWCEPVGPGDLRCPDGQIPRRLEGVPGQECIANEGGHEYDGLRYTCDRASVRGRCVFPVAAAPDTESDPVPRRQRQRPARGVGGLSD